MAAKLTARVTNMNGQIVAEKRGGQHRVLNSDPLGNVVDVRDSAGTQLASYNFWPYGEVRISTGSISNPWMFCGVWGYYNDGSTYYVRARTYRPDLTRWLTVDPIWPYQLPFGYVYNSPVNAIDKLGLSSCRKKVNDTCRPTPRDVPCCTPLIRCVTSPGGRFDGSRGSFTMSLPVQATGELRHGTLYVQVDYYITYLATGAVKCPPPEWQTKFFTTSSATSGKARLQYQGGSVAGRRYWPGWCEQNGPAPPSSVAPTPYRLHTECLTPADEEVDAMTQGNESFKFLIHGKFRTPSCSPHSNTLRGRFLVHPDGDNDGTGGCIGLPDPQTSENFRSCMHWAAFYGCSSMPFSIFYPPG